MVGNLDLEEFAVEPFPSPYYRMTKLGDLYNPQDLIIQKALLEKHKRIAGDNLARRIIVNEQILFEHKNATDEIRFKLAESIAAYRIELEDIFALTEVPYNSYDSSIFVPCSERPSQEIIDIWKARALEFSELKSSTFSIHGFRWISLDDLGNFYQEHL